VHKSSVDKKANRMYAGKMKSYYSIEQISERKPAKKSIRTNLKSQNTLMNSIISSVYKLIQLRGLEQVGGPIANLATQEMAWKLLQVQTTAARKLAVPNKFQKVIT